MNQKDINIILAEAAVVYADCAVDASYGNPLEKHIEPLKQQIKKINSLVDPELSRNMLLRDLGEDDGATIFEIGYRLYRLLDMITSNGQS